MIFNEKLSILKSLGTIHLIFEIPGIKMEIHVFFKNVAFTFCNRAKGNKYISQL